MTAATTQRREVVIVGNLFAVLEGGEEVFRGTMTEVEDYLNSLDNA